MENETGVSEENQTFAASETDKTAALSSDPYADRYALYCECMDQLYRLFYKKVKISSQFKKKGWEIKAKIKEEKRKNDYWIAVITEKKCSIEKINKTRKKIEKKGFRMEKEKKKIIETDRFKKKKIVIRRYRKPENPEAKEPKKDLFQ